MRHILHKTLFACLAALVAGGCAAPRPARFARAYDLNQPGLRIGAFADCDSERIARLVFNKAEIVLIDDVERGCLSLITERIDGLVYDEHILRLVAWRYPDRFRVLEPALDTEPSSIAVAKTRADLLGELNAFIAESRASGLYDEMFLRWFHDPERREDNIKDLPPIPEPPENAPTLRVGTDCAEEPNSYLDENGDLCGFDVEFAYRFAHRRGYRVEFVVKPFTELLADVAAGRLDCAVANLNRDAKCDVLWSDGYVACDVVMLVKNADEEGETP